MNSHTRTGARNEKPPKKRRALRITLISLASLTAATLGLTLFTPYPVSYITRKMFEKGITVYPVGYEAMRERVTVIENLQYPSAHRYSTLDLYMPNSGGGAVPLVLWIHGGAFVGGDKGDIAVYATALASEGYAVACMNYERAPEAKYPTPVIQTGEAYLWLLSASAEYGFDAGRLTLAGDSAGAHIAAQFAIIQGSAEYSEAMGIAPVIPAENIKAALLFCGPYSVSGILEIEHPVLKFLLGKTAWAYFGERAWTDGFSAQATIAGHVTAAFPPSFISDGNTASFEPHGRELAEALEAHGVPTETYFIPVEEEVANHEYQFIMNTPTGMESFRRTLEFLKKYA